MLVAFTSTSFNEKAPAKLLNFKQHFTIKDQ